ncbi:hypothetical protein [Bacillus sp. T33-2]|uniref:hypothetical protein n=1 Tax=Bacillus sp. T33-2 TaxID=2054168 RepID=UPI000C769DDD|nr:hypothetical protein [Bacillus sp. T33-2]PLR94145.1 hypothetical protein CVD19_17845 [Bacillus sp. T33-2]
MTSNQFSYYLEMISQLPLKDGYEKEEILTEDFLIEKDRKMEVYYCTHNEYINHEAKIFIIGITPGFVQMNKSIAVARKCLAQNVPHCGIPYICKRESRFFGPMRKNIIEMLDELELAKALEIESAAQLFGEKDGLLHTTSVIPYAVFIDGRNYTGHSPKLLSDHLLLKYMNGYFVPQAKALKNALFIPLGRSVEGVLGSMIAEGLIKQNQCLSGFPHPSGANGHRTQQFESNKQKMKKIICSFF